MLGLIQDTASFVTQITEKKTLTYEQCTEGIPNGCPKSSHADNLAGQTVKYFNVIITIDLYLDPPPNLMMGSPMA